jgi:aspartate aminotransferase
MAALQSQSVSHVTSFVQWAGIAAAKLPGESLNAMLTEFDKRRNYCIKRLDKMTEHLSYQRPEGAFYFFVNLSKWLNRRQMNDLDFCKELLAKYHVGVVPGSSFGKEYFLRLSYATSMANLEKAFDRMEKYILS